jgi:glucose/arabinose dehydrogenase
MLRRVKPRPRSAPAVLILSLAFLCAPALAQPQLELLTDQVVQPIYVTHAGDARLFIVERAGRVRVFENGALLPTPYLDVSAQVNTEDEGALASIAFHPDYPRNGRMFVFFTEASDGPGPVLVVARFTVSATEPNRVDPDSRRDLLRLPKDDTIHHGGQLQFGPDGFLYVSLGDGGGNTDPACNAQNPQQLFGKLLRLDVDIADDVPPWYRIPATNPFADPFDGVPDEIWALGLRNPFRFSFDRSSGSLWIGDVGQFEREEIDLQPASSPGGENYGWKVLEGTLCLLPGNPVGGSCPPDTLPCGDPGYVPPVFEYERGPSRFASVIGGVVYRGSESPAFQGRYFFADTFIGALWALRERVPPFTAELLPLDEISGPVAIGEDRDGEFYVADLFANRVFRLRLPSAAVVPDAACVLATNTASAKLAQAAARDLGACALAGARGRLGSGTVEACILEDRKGAVQKRIGKLEQVAASECQDEQPFGFVGAAAAVSAAVGSERELAHAVFGPDLDAALADASEAKDTHRCQRKVQRALETCQKARRAAFLRCKKEGLRDGSIGSLAQLAACLDADPKGRIEKACDASGGRPARAISRSCEGVDLGAAFPGCASGTPGGLAACLESAGRCRSCRLFDAVDALGANCELYDDGAMNASCGPLE